MKIAQAKTNKDRQVWKKNRQHASTEEGQANLDEENDSLEVHHKTKARKVMPGGRATLTENYQQLLARLKWKNLANPQHQFQDKNKAIAEKQIELKKVPRKGCKLTRRHRNHFRKNKRKKCLRDRVENELSPAGKCQTRAVWKKIENQKFGFGSGVLPRRRREKGSPHQRILHWRAKQARKHMSMSLHESRSELPDDTHFAVIDDDFEEESDKAIQKDKSRRLIVPPR